MVLARSRPWRTPHGARRERLQGRSHDHADDRGGRRWPSDVRRRTIAMLNHVLGLKNVVVVHHTFCGMIAASAQGIIDTYRRDHERNIESAFPRESLSVPDCLARRVYCPVPRQELPSFPQIVQVTRAKDFHRGTNLRWGHLRAELLPQCAELGSVPLDCLTSRSGCSAASKISNSSRQAGQRLR